MKKIILGILSFISSFSYFLLDAAQPKLSIIVSLGERRDLLAGLLADLTQQTIFPQSELLLIGSKEYNCPLDIAPYLHKYENIRFIFMKGSFDEINLLNFAIEQSKSPFIVKVRAGDIHLPDAFKQRVAVLDANELIDVVYGDYWWSYSPHKRPQECKKFDISILPEFNPETFCVALPGPEPLWRKSLHKRFGYFEKEFNYKFEWAFWKKIVFEHAVFKKTAQPDMMHFINIQDTKGSDYPLKMIQIMDQEQAILKKYGIKADKALVEKPMVIIVPSYNNAVWCERNIDSILMQDYQNYRIIYINDASKDSTDFNVRNYIRLRNQEHRFTYIKNTERKGCPLANICYALSLCNPEEIAVLMDGDDWFAHENVLNYLNAVYSDPNVWLTYGQFAVFPFEMIGWAHSVPLEIIKENKIRDYHWVTSHLRSFYVHLFNHIRMEDLLYEGHYLPMAGDLGLMFPLVELAGFHSRFISEILYIYNRANALNEDKVNKELQTKCERTARAGNRYNPL